MSTPISLRVSTSSGDVPLTADERGSGPAVVVLHGGAGPASVAAFADLLAAETGTRVVVPVHPGFGGTPRPAELTTVAGLAEAYAGLLESLDLADATVIGNSLGGWVAAELALRHPTRLGRIALVDAVGIAVPGHPVGGPATPAEAVRRAWFDPTKAPQVDPETLPAAEREVLAGNRATLALYGGTMSDPTLAGRLVDVDVPALVVWGEADRVADPDYGRAYAAAIPGARFALLPRTGHVPQLETPQALLEALRAFVVG